ncbi:MAG TPA: hypothetical protein VKN82_04525 [Desulfohalobiaceae bacterium]|nr:hypothetical protein [Desulfohalobiaceae bacterium]
MNTRSLNSITWPNIDYPYFRKTWNKVVVVLLASAFIPLFLIGGGMYYFTTSSLKSSTLNQLRIQVKSHQQSIDQFFQERILQLQMIAQDISLSSKDPQSALEGVFDKLHSTSSPSCFYGLGLIDRHGHYLAYVGKNVGSNTDYTNRLWLEQAWDKDVYISNVLQGNNQKKCFTISVKTNSDRSFVLSGQLYMDHFKKTVRDFLAIDNGQVFFVSDQGISQFSWSKEKISLPVSYLKDVKTFQGVRIEDHQDKLAALSWLQSVSWLCLLQVDKDILFSSLKKARIIGLAAFILGSILILFTVLLTTDYLVNRLEVKRKNIQLLDRKLLHMSRMASSMQLSYGFFRELKDAFVNIDMTVSLIQDAIQRNQAQNHSNSLTQIKSEIRRCQRAIDNFLSFTTPPGTSWLIRDIQVNDLLNEFLVFIRNELRLKSIVVYRNLDNRLPMIRSNISRMRQAVQNLFLTVISDMPEGGEVNLKTEAEEEGVKISLTYLPNELDQNALENIVDPLWTDQIHGPGVWLALCIDHAERLKGKLQISVEREDYLTLTLFFPLSLI